MLLLFLACAGGAPPQQATSAAAPEPLPQMSAHAVDPVLFIQQASSPPSVRVAALGEGEASEAVELTEGLSELGLAQPWLTLHVAGGSPARPRRFALLTASQGVDQPTWLRGVSWDRELSFRLHEWQELERFAALSALSPSGDRLLMAEGDHVCPRIFAVGEPELELVEEDSEALCHPGVEQQRARWWVDPGGAERLLIAESFYADVDYCLRVAVGERSSDGVWRSRELSEWLADADPEAEWRSSELCGDQVDVLELTVQEGGARALLRVRDDGEAKEEVAAVDDLVVPLSADVALDGLAVPRWDDVYPEAPRFSGGGGFLVGWEEDPETTAKAYAVVALEPGAWGQRWGGAQEAGLLGAPYVSRERELVLVGNHFDEGVYGSMRWFELAAPDALHEVEGSGRLRHLMDGPVIEHDDGERLRVFMAEHGDLRVVTWDASGAWLEEVDEASLFERELEVQALAIDGPDSRAPRLVLGTEDPNELFLLPLDLSSATRTALVEPARSPTEP